MTRRHLARRAIPVAVQAPVQLPLGLGWADPIDRAPVARDPEPAAPAVVVARLRRAAA